MRACLFSALPWSRVRGLWNRRPPCLHPKKSGCGVLRAPKSPARPVAEAPPSPPQRQWRGMARPPPHLPGVLWHRGIRPRPGPIPGARCGHYPASSLWEHHEISARDGSGGPQPAAQQAGACADCAQLRDARHVCACTGSPGSRQPTPCHAKWTLLAMGSRVVSGSLLGAIPSPPPPPTLGTTGGKRGIEWG